MAQDENYQEEASIKIWLAALAVSVLLMGVLFALLVFYVGQMREDTTAVLLQIDAVNQRLDTLTTQITRIQHDAAGQPSSQPAAVSGPSAPDAATTSQSPQTLLPQPDAGATPTAAPAPVIETPTLVAPPMMAPSLGAAPPSPHQP